SATGRATRACQQWPAGAPRNWPPRTLVCLGAAGRQRQGDTAGTARPTYIAEKWRAAAPRNTYLQGNRARPEGVTDGQYTTEHGGAPPAPAGRHRAGGGRGRRRVAGAVRRPARRGGVRGPATPARADGAGRLPARARQRPRRRGRLPGGVPGPGP